MNDAFCDAVQSALSGGWLALDLQTGRSFVRDRKILMPRAASKDSYRSAKATGHHGDPRTPLRWVGIDAPEEMTPYAGILSWRAIGELRGYYQPHDLEILEDSFIWTELITESKKPKSIMLLLDIPSSGDRFITEYHKEASGLLYFLPITFAGMSYDLPVEVERQIISDRIRQVVDDADLAQLRQILLFALGIGDVRQAPPLAPPPVPVDAPQKWEADRQDGETATDFLARVWGQWLGRLDQRTLRDRDPKLMQKLDNDYRGRRSDLRKFLPTKSDESQRLLEAAGISPQNPRDRQRIASALRQARL